MKTKLNKLISLIVILILNAGLIGCVTSENVTQPPNVIVGKTVTSSHFDGIETDSSNNQFNIQPMFQIKSLSFHVNDETGRTNLWSDEIYGHWVGGMGLCARQSSNHACSSERTQGYVRVKTYTYGSVDVGDTITFHEFQSCIYPIIGRGLIDGSEGENGLSNGWQCVAEGGRAPISMHMSLHESDDFDFPVCFSGDILIGCEDDLIGDFRKDWTLQELLTRMPNPGDEHTISLKMIGDFSNYDYIYKIVRMPNKLIPFQLDPNL